MNTFISHHRVEQKMHYIFVLGVLALICFGTGGQAHRFASAWDTATVGDLEGAVREVVAGVRETLRAADPRLPPKHASRNPDPAR